MRTDISAWRVLLKGVLLFILLESVLVWLLPSARPTNVYAALNMKRQRFPLSTDSPADDAQDLGNLDAMFAAHVVSNPKGPDEFRVLVLGDSAVWGLQLEPKQTMPAQLDALGLSCGEKTVRVYNLSFPRSSATKDLMILDKAMQYKPDMIVWLITWYTLMPKTRVDHVLVNQNPAEFYQLARRFDFLPRDYPAPTALSGVLARNRALFRETRFGLYSLVQLATGREQLAGPPEVLPSALSRDTTFEGLKPPTLLRSQVSLDQLEDFYSIAANTPVILVNEPMQVLRGVPNSDVLYNSYYPRWVYDQYRRYVREAVKAHGWKYLDWWNKYPAQYFTDTPLHLNPEGEHLLAKALAPAIQKGCP